MYRRVPAANLPWTMKSPCTGYCRFDPDTGWCLGCGRSRADCRSWKLRPEMRPGILGLLKRRLLALRDTGREAGRHLRRG